MTEIIDLFPQTYEASRERFRKNLKTIQAMWPQAKRHQRTISKDEDLTIDWIYSEALERNEKVFMLTTGEHGVEGYVGSAMLQRFIERYMPQLDPRTTGLLLVHAINPWGMKHHRRVNANNVDLNRTFVYSGDFDPAFNAEYDKVNAFLNPALKLHSVEVSDLFYYPELAAHIARLTSKGFRYAMLLGQYRHPRGLYYGGTGYQAETKKLIELYRMALGAYDQFLHLDMHTGYGPRYQMSLVNSMFEKRTSQEFVERFKYPLVVAATIQEFYAIKGDMVDFVYELWQHEFPQKRMFSSAFEFGTLGDRYYGLLQSPRVMIHENRAFWHGTRDETVLTRARQGFEELFNPSAADWKAKAVADGDQAFDGILRTEGYIPTA